MPHHAGKVSMHALFNAAGTRRLLTDAVSFDCPCWRFSLLADAGSTLNAIADHVLNSSNPPRRYYDGDLTSGVCPTGLSAGQSGERSEGGMTCRFTVIARSEATRQSRGECAPAAGLLRCARNDSMGWARSCFPRLPRVFLPAPGCPISGRLVRHEREPR